MRLIEREERDGSMNIWIDLEKVFHSIFKEM